MATAHTQSTSSSSKGSQAQPVKRFHGRLKVDAKFCPTDVDDLFATVDWEVRSSQIKGENGELIFEQTNCEVPSFWSQLATNVICSKYFYGEVGTPEREYSVKQLVHRVARTIADWGLEDGYFASAARRRAVLPRAGLALPASARRVQLARVVQRRPVSPVRRHRREVQLALGRRSAQDVVAAREPVRVSRKARACFIQHVDDNMEDIMELARSEAMLFKFGSGTGTDLSHAPLAPREARRRRQAQRARSRSCASTTRSPRS